jgi:Immunoglobulin I-set domain
MDTVIIDNLNYTHDGVYECEVYNGVGKTQKRIIELKVAALKEPIFLNRTDVLIVAKIDETRSFVCECEHCLPIRSYTWTLNDVPIDNPNVRVNSSSSITDHFKTILTIDRVGHDHEGSYKCVLENDLNSASHEIVLNILKKPGIQRITVSNSLIGDEGEFFVQENQSSTLDCQHFGLIKTFDWFKDDTRISSERYLKLDAATYNDSGVYRCEVSNSKGSDEKSVVVQVHGHPRIVSEFPKSMVKLTGVELEVECKGTGFPMPNIRWENEEGNVMSTANGVLKLNAYIYHFSTIFTCYVDNYIGTASRSTVMRFQHDLMFPNIALQLLCPLRAGVKVDWYKVSKLR